MGCASDPQPVRSLPVSDTSGGKDQNPLLVLLDAIAGGFSLGSASLGDRLVYGSHFECFSTLRLMLVVEKSCRRPGDVLLDKALRRGGQFSKKKNWSAKIR